MFDRRFILTGSAVLMVTAVSFLLATFSGEPSAPLGETVTGVEQPPAQQMEEVPEEEPRYTYIIREYQGHIAVFSTDDQEEPELVLDTAVRFLPDYDRAQLEDGIQVQDYKELVALIEDFIS